MFQFSQEKSELRNKITQAYRIDESVAVQNLLGQINLSTQQNNDIENLAKKLIQQVRTNRTKSSGVDALMFQFSLSSEEGVSLMCLAEALLRVPDKATQSKLIKDKLSGADWRSHLNQSPSLFVNAAAWGLLLTGKLSDTNNEQSLSASLTRILSKGGEPLIRKAIDYAIRLLGKQFVTGQNINEAIKNGKKRENAGYRFSFDMLGEAALTQEDADRYYDDYVKAIHAIGSDANNAGVYEGNGISVKLSAIHPRYHRAQHNRVMTELLPKLKSLFLLAKKYNIALNIDAEEANRLELSLDLMEALALDPDLSGYKGIGFVVQAYQKRCPYVIDYLIDLARRSNHRFMIRLVKGAYWDSEIKWAQVDGLEGYPVYTRKIHTDVSYLACAKKLLSAQDAIFPQFASHNAHTVSVIYHLGKGLDYEFQCLHGMGETLYDQIVGEQNLGKRVRIYAPVGTHETLLAYLVRRLLENGANSSFVNQIVDEKITIESLTRSPIEEAKISQGKMHAALNLPRNLYKDGRINSKGMDLSNELVLIKLEKTLNQALKKSYHISSLIKEGSSAGEKINIINPANHADVIGTAEFALVTDIPKIIKTAKENEHSWQSVSAEERAETIEKFADLLENHYPIFMMLAIRESGKTLQNTISEIREAIDFCRYYAKEIRTLSNQKPIGTVVAISPWNFPLAIFIGELVSALAAGNTVIVKPAEQTMLIAHTAVEYLYEAGVPKEVVQLILGAGEIGAALTQNEDINGVIFTGSTEVARLINISLAKRSDLPVLIAETGGQNAMIVDSTALPEQVIQDVIQSAFDSAGQRCSALRILCLQDGIADYFIDMLKGAMKELRVGDPIYLNTDIGPVIDKEAQQNLLNHIEKMKKIALSFTEISLTPETQKGTFVAPILFELSDLSQLKNEVFGPVLHVVRYREKELDQLIDAINEKGYALTHGIHSRINKKIEHICRRIEAGNIYINRNIVGAVVGVQPFGGHGLSGTGPKAGGPFYLQRLMHMDKWIPPEINYFRKINEQNIDKLESSIKKLSLKSNELGLLKTAVGQVRIGSLYQSQAQLDGPTGESNVLTWHLPKKVWLYGGNLEKSIAAFFELAVSDTHIYVFDKHPLAKYSDILSAWLTVHKQPWKENITVLIAMDNVTPDIKLKLAEQKGPLIKIVPAQNKFDLLKVFQEISRSTNTTAAGGNASLMSLSDH